MFSTSLALLGGAFQGRERGTAFGVWGAITGLAVAVGPVVGGALTTGLSWRWIFLVNVPIGVFAIALCLLPKWRSPAARARRQADLIGAITFSGALAALVYALIKGNSSGLGFDHDPRVPDRRRRAAGRLRGRRAIRARERVVRPRRCSASRPSRAASIAAFALSAGHVRAAALHHPVPPGRARLLGALQTGLRRWCCPGASCSPRRWPAG